MNYPKPNRYKVHNKAKYVADLQEVVYRSSWELKYMKYLDRAPNVLEWASENVIIPYYNQIEKKTRRYFVDFYVKVQNPEGLIKKYIIEVKPASQCRPPKRRNRISSKYKNDLRRFIVNQNKWKSARKWAEQRGMEFIILTEKELDIPKNPYKYKKNGNKNITKS
jgi:hypothetical protein